MRLNPFLYRESDKAVELYVGGCETKVALQLFDIKETLSIDCLGATSYKKLGWATETDIPPMKTVGEFLSFLTTEGDIGLIEFKAQVGDIVKVSSHDDGECNFQFRTKNSCISVLRSILPPEHVGMFIAKLLSHQGIYLELLESGVVNKYSNFGEYISKNA